MKRRQFVKGGIAAVAMAGAGTTGLFLLNKKGFISTAYAGDFKTPLPIPPLLENLDSSGQTTRFKMVAQTGSREFFSGKITKTFAYNGDFLGPTIRVRNGQKFNIQIDNQLPEVTTLHWHGLHLPAKWDGGPGNQLQQEPPGTLILPSSSRRQLSGITPMQ